MKEEKKTKYQTFLDQVKEVELRPGSVKPIHLFQTTFPPDAHTHVKSDITDTPWAWADVSKTGSSLADLATRNHSDLQSVTSDQHHAQLHASEHEVGGGDLLAFADISGFSDYLDQGVRQADSPTHVTAKLTALTDGYVPYHVSDASGLANSPIRIDGTKVGIGVVPGNALHVAGKIQVNTTSQKIHSNIWEVVNSTADMKFRIGSTDAMIIQKVTRNVGIGKVPTERLDVNGNVKATIAAGAADYDKFLVSDGGLVKYRTGAQVLSDIGASGSGHSHAHSTITDVTSGQHHAQLHAASHQNGGGDEISVAGLSGELADNQPPKTHASSHVSGGGDSIKLDDLAAPDDNTDLDFSTSKHGLVPKGTNVGDFLKDDGTWAAVAAGAHAASHQNGAGDEISVAALSGLLADDQHVLDAEVITAAKTIKLDDFTVPDDNTDLDVLITKHGLCPKAPNDLLKFLRGDGSWAAVVKDKIEEGNSSVEVIDAGTGYIETKADGSQVRKDAVLGNIQPLQPCFYAYFTSHDTNVTGDGTWYLVAGYDAEGFDQGANFNITTGIFTAPVTGKYFLSFTIMYTNLNASHVSNIMQFYTSNNQYYVCYINPGLIRAPDNSLTLNFTVIADMDANDTAYPYIYVAGSTKTVGIFSGTRTGFTGALIC